MGWLPYSTPGTTGTRPNSLSAVDGRAYGLRVRDLVRQSHGLLFLLTASVRLRWRQGREERHPRTR